MEELFDLTVKHKLTDEQKRHWREIRKKGKNALAQLGCRNRKKNRVTELEKQVAEIRTKKKKLKRQHAALTAEKLKQAVKLDKLTSSILNSLGRSPQTHTMVTEMEEVYVVEKAPRERASNNEEIIAEICGPFSESWTNEM